MHEECSAAAANGYAKIEGKPALVCAHGTVGIQHAAMAIYNAYCDQAPRVRRRRQYLRRRRTPGPSRMAARRPGRCRHGARLHQVGRQSRFADALRRIGRARLSDRHDRAHDAGGAGRRRRSAGRRSAQGIRLAHSETPEDLPAVGRFGSRGRAGAAAGGRGESSDRNQPLRAHARRLEAAGGTGGITGAGGDRSAAPHELPLPPSPQSNSAFARRHRRLPT